MKTEMTEEQVTRALIDPASVFSNPMAVVAEDSLSTECKIEILRRDVYRSITSLMEELEAVDCYKQPQDHVLADKIITR